MKIKRIEPKIPINFSNFMELNNLTLVIRPQHTGSVNDWQNAVVEVTIQNERDQDAFIYISNYEILKGKGSTEFLAIKHLVQKISNNEIIFPGDPIIYLKVGSLYPHEV